MLFAVKVLNRLMFFLELVTAAGLFWKRLRPRKWWWARLLLCLVAAVGAICCYVLGKGRLMEGVPGDFNPMLFWISYLLTVVYEVLSITLCGVTVALVFKTNVSTVVFVSSVAFSMQSIADNILSLLLWGSDQGSFTVQHFTRPIHLIAFLTVYLLVYGLCYRLFIRDYEDRGEDPLTRRVILIAVCISTINMILGGVETPQNSAQASQLFLFMLAARLLLGLLGLIVLFYLIKWTKLQFEYEKQEYMMQQQRQQYEVAKESVNMVNINAHDLRGQISVIKEAIRTSGKGGMIQDGLREMEKYVDSVDTGYHTGNSALDIVLTEKARQCKAKSIQFSAIADGSALERMSDVDIYVFFGNALDNAIEAAEEIADPEGRIISLCLRREVCGVVIHVENTFAIQPKFERDIPQTHKEGPFHGYGTRSMASIAEKYSGNVKLYVSGELFCLDCYIP